MTSPNDLYKKLEEYGADHDSVVKEMVDNDGKWLYNCIIMYNYLYSFHIIDEKNPMSCYLLYFLLSLFTEMLQL